MSLVFLDPSYCIALIGCNSSFDQTQVLLACCPPTAARSKLGTSPKQRVMLVGMVLHRALQRGMLEATCIVDNNPCQSSTLASPHIIQIHVQIFPVLLLVQCRRYAGQAGGDSKPPSKSRLVRV